MKKDYSKPESEILEYLSVDVFTASSVETDIDNEFEDPFASESSGYKTE